MVSLIDLVFLGILGSTQGTLRPTNMCGEIFNERNMEFMCEYTNWRRISYVILLEEQVKSVCGIKFMADNIQLFSENGVFISMQSSTNSLDQVLGNKVTKSLVVTFVKDNYSSNEFIEQANKITAYGGEAVAWLVVSISNRKNLLDNLRYATFSIDADIVIASSNTKMIHHQDTNKQDDKRNNSSSLNKTSNAASEGILLRFTENDTKTTFNVTDYCTDEFKTLDQSAFCLVQVYKIRKTYNTSLVIHNLGFWTKNTGRKYLRPYLYTDKRRNFYKFPLIAGMRDFTKYMVGDEIIIHDEGDGDLNNFFSYFVNFLNSSETIIHYNKLGMKEANEDWSDLLGAIIKEEVDIGIDVIIRTAEKSTDMSFAHDIMTFRRNIYVQPKESNEFRDIFLIPFDSRLILCVIGSGFVFSVAMTINNKIAEISGAEAYRKRGLIDSLVWCVGVFCQQGSILKPRLYAGQMIVVISLAFTLLIYNSYSAFITSVLSVDLVNIRTVDDLLDSDYEIGYTKNSQDEVYLRSMNMSQLNEIYLRGYLHNNISNVSEGLLKVTKGNYGFFATSQVARRVLLNISNYKCKYHIDEIPIKYTTEKVAFALSKRSPYKSLINLCIIKMYETGVHKYIDQLINQNLLQCNTPKLYQSARLPDLSTAFSVLILGHIFGVVFVISECLWNRKRKIYRHLKQKILKKRRGNITLQSYIN